MDPQIIFIPYDYVVTTSAALAAGASGNSSLLLDQDADFELHYIIGSSSLDVSSDYRPNYFKVQMQDKSNARLWSSDYVPQSHLAQNDGPGRLVRPVVLAKRTNLYFTFVNLGGSAMTPTLTLRGAKVMKSS